MSQLKQLERLVVSGNQANIELARQLVMSPRLHKARGILKRCGMRVFPPQEAGQGLWSFIKHNTSATPCNCQSRVTCKICERTVCKTHFRFDVMECTDCGGNDSHYYTPSKVTEAQWKRIWEKSSQDIERTIMVGASLDHELRMFTIKGRSGRVSHGLLRESYDRLPDFLKLEYDKPNERLADAVFLKPPQEPQEKAKSKPVGEPKKPVKHNPRPSRFGFLEGLKNGKRK